MHRLFIGRVLVVIGLLIAANGLLVSQAPSPRDVLQRFCELDEQGEQLTPDGWQKIAALFVTPGAPRRDSIVVVRDFVVSRKVLENGKAEFYVEYIQLGRIEPSQARFSSLPIGKVRAGFFLAKQSAAEWRITGAVPEPHLSVDTAIRYTTELLANTRDAGIRKNADKTLAALKCIR